MQGFQGKKGSGGMGEDCRKVPGCEVASVTCHASTAGGDPPLCMLFAILDYNV